MFEKFCQTGLVLATAIIAGTANAATIEFNSFTGNAMETAYGMRDDTTTRGADLDGAIVTATFVDGSQEAVTWQALDQWTNGTAVGDDFTVSMGWMGFELSTTNLLASIEFYLAPASTVFDISLAAEGADGNTPTSRRGYPFEIYEGGDILEGIINVTYLGAVNLAGQAAAGDLFTTMLVDFTQLATGGLFGDVSFQSDMDTLRYAGDLAPADVPLPASFALLLCGIAGLGINSRRS
jgi:hypothetical protein